MRQFACFVEGEVVVYWREIYCVEFRKLKGSIISSSANTGLVTAIAALLIFSIPVTHFFGVRAEYSGRVYNAPNFGLNNFNLDEVTHLTTLRRSISPILTLTSCLPSACKRGEASSQGKET